MSRSSAALLALLFTGFTACSGGDVATTAATSRPTTTLPPSPSSTPTELTSPITDAPSATNATTMPTTVAVTIATAATATTAPESTFDFSPVSAIVDGFVTERGLNGAGLAIVHRDHGLVHHEHWGEFGPGRVSLIASSSKMIVAGVLLRLQDDGLLDVDAPVAELAEWGTGNPAITPAQLVSNSSGLVGLGPDPAYAPYVCQWIPSDELQRCAAQIFTTDADDGDVIEPDTQFRYGGAQWQIAGAVAEVASGRSWAELVDEIYVEPCGVESLAFNNHFTQLGPGGFAYPTEFDGDPAVLDDTSNPNLEGGAYITSGDYAELLLMHLRDGRCEEGHVLSTEAVARLHEDRIGEAYGGSAGIDVGYGMGWWIDRTNGRLSDPGAYGSVAWLDLDDGYGAYLVIEATAAAGNELAGLLFGPVDDILGS